MLHICKRFSINFRLVVFIIFWAIFLVSPAFAEQKVYLIDKKVLNILRAVYKRSGFLGVSRLILTSPNSFKLVDQNLAREIFNITWLEESIDAVRPALFVVNLGGGLGYGLFNSDRVIGEGDLITAYLGEQVTEMDLRNLESSEYLVCPEGDVSYGVNAKNSGNAGRFSMYFPSSDTLSNHYVFARDDINIATANSRLVNVNYSSFDGLFLQATRDIQPFEQIGWDYGPDYDWGNVSPRLFDQNGEVVSSELYHTVNRMIYLDVEEGIPIRDDDRWGEREIDSTMEIPIVREDNTPGRAQFRITESLLNAIRGSWSIVVRASGNFVS